MELAVNVKTPQVRLNHLAEKEKEALKESVLQFMDTIAVASSRATFYNTKAEVQSAVESIHQQLFGLERGIYGLALLLPGVNDYAMQTGIYKLLSENASDTNGALLNAAQEMILVKKLVDQLPPQRVLNTFIILQQKRVNNSRTRRLILATLLNSAKLELWSVKYRSKIRKVLVHAWGERSSSIIKSILLKDESIRTGKEKAILKDNIYKYLESNVNKHKVQSAIGFVMESKTAVSALPLHTSFRAAKVSLEDGRILPYEVLEGIRSTYHPSRKNEEVLELTKAQLGKTQKMVFQRKAAEQKVEVSFDPLEYDAVKLYIYAYEMGLTSEIRNALELKSQKLAESLPVSFGRTGILIDNSASMKGNDTQKMHPISIALATKDVLAAASSEAHIRYGRKMLQADNTLVKCSGDTSMGEGLVELLEMNLDSIFIISDGYENTPSGRIYELAAMAKAIGIFTPIIHINPVMAAEAKGVRELGTGISTFPLNRPEALGIGLMKSIISLDVEKGVSLLVGKSLALIANQ
ncbi:MAG: VWA domain-containing protein [Pedobacter sp.]|nr:MAG: VWA domain-containing protein [Pedobacter sp.]